MKKNFLLLTLLILSSYFVKASNPLRFNSDGTFKIIQFTDVHYKQGLKESEAAINLIEEVLDEEKPDLVIFTGDIIWASPVKLGLDEVFEPVIKRQIPWAYVFGNHDDEFEMSRSEIMEYVIQKPFCLAKAGDSGLSGVGNYILEITNREDKKVESILYCMDSGAYSPIKEIGTYNWFGFDQVDWYRMQSKIYTDNNDGIPLPGLAFFHIPLAEYPLMKAEKDSLIIGHKDETECNGKLNTGMFAAMREQGDVMGTFVGHDHNNDYIGEYYDICLAYGRYSGGNTVYNDLGKNGCRVIILKEGERTFDSYLRLLGGEILFEINYPITFSTRLN